MSTRNLTIMFTDIKEFTARVSDGSREDLTSLRSLHDRLMIPVFNHFEGDIIKTIGDAFLVCFKSPTDAVMCGVTIQEVLRQHNAFAAENERLDVRVAINSGDVEITGSDVFGEPVNIAARLEGIAEAGEVYFTEAVYLSMNRNEAPSAEIGERSFKGIPYPIKIYKATLEPETELSKRLAEGVKFTSQGPVIRGLHKSQNHKQKRLIIAGLSTLVIVVMIAIFLLMPSRYDRALKEARSKIEKGVPAFALEIVDPLLRQTPGNSELSELAITAAKMQIEHLQKSQGTKAALTWLSTEIGNKPYLEPLRDKIPLLDAVLVAEQVIENKNDDKWCNKELKGLLERYPGNQKVPYKTASMLEGKVFMGFPLWMYTEALNRGAEADGRIYDFCIRLFGKNHSGWLRSAHGIVEKHYRKKGISWAIAIMDTDASGNHYLYENAWQILLKAGDPRIENQYYLSFMNLANGYTWDRDQVDASIKTFLELDDPFRKKQVLTMARKRVKYRSGYMDDVERTLQLLEVRWGKNN